MLNNGVFKKWVKGHLCVLEHKFMSWYAAFFVEFHSPGIRYEKVIAFRAEYTDRCGSGSGRSISLDNYTYVACVYVDR